MSCNCSSLGSSSCWQPDLEKHPDAHSCLWTRLGVGVSVPLGFQACRSGSCNAGRHQHGSRSRRAASPSICASSLSQKPSLCEASASRQLRLSRCYQPSATYPVCRGWTWEVWQVRRTWTCTSISSVRLLQLSAGLANIPGLGPAPATAPCPWRSCAKEKQGTNVQETCDLSILSPRSQWNIV